MTLNGRYTLYWEKMRLSETTTKIWMKIDLYYRKQKCRPMTLVSGDIKLMRIFAEVPWGGGVKRHWGCQERQFSAFSQAISSETLEVRPPFYFIATRSPSSAIQWFQTVWPWMTLTGYLALNSVFAPVWMAETARIRKTIAWKVIKIETYCKRCKSSAGTTVSGDIRFVRIFGRVL